MKNQIFAVLFVLCAGVTVSAQSYPSSVYVGPTGRQRSPQEAELMKRVYETQRSIWQTAAVDESLRRSRSPSVSVSLFSPELSSAARKFIVPNREIKSKYNDFLKLPGTGIFKLLTPQPCASTEGNKTEKLTDIVARCPYIFIKGGGHFFSFRQNEHVDYQIADLGFKDNLFFSYGTLNQGIIAALDNVDLKDISLTSKEVDFLAKFTPAATLEGAAKDAAEFETGFKADGVSYQKSVAAEKGKTYLLRVAAYNPYYMSAASTKKNPSVKIYPLKDDVRKDIIIAFKVVEKTDDSLILIWKELRRIDSPEVLIPAIELQ